MRTAYLTVALLSLVSILFIAEAGRITPWGDPDLFNPNKGYITYINLYFTLDTKLPQGHVLRVNLPFSSQPAISTIQVWSTSSTKGAIQANWASLTSGSITGSVRYQGSSSPYQNYLTFSSDLSPSTTYVMRITFSSSPNDVGYLGYIQMETMSPADSTASSSGSDTPITYDVNNAFASLQVFAAPGAATFTSVTNDTNALVAGTTYVRQFKITPSQAFFYWPTIAITWDNSNFTAASVVNADTGVNTGSATPLSSSLYSSKVTSGSVLIYHNALLLPSQTVIYNISITNPSIAANTSFSLQIYHRYNYNLTDVLKNAFSLNITLSASSGSSSTTSPAIISPQVLLSWGIDPNSTFVTANSNTLQKVFKIYGTAATNQLYQSLKFVFATSGSYPSGNYTVSLSVCSSIANCDVLDNSVVSSLTGASCVTSLPSSGTVKVICSGVTTISSTNNSIAARIWLNGATTSAIYNSGAINDTNFGLISIASSASGWSTVTSPALSSPYNLMNSLLAPPLINLNGNGPLTGVINSSALWTGSTATGLIASTSGSSSYDVSSSGTNAMRGGIFGSTTGGTYNLALMTQAIMNTGSGTSTYTGATVPGTTTGQAPAPGVDLFLNPNLFSAVSATSGVISSCWAANTPTRSTTAFSSAATAAQNAWQAHCFSNMYQSSAVNQYLRLRYIFTSKFSTIGSLAATGGPAATALDTITASKKYTTFFWENAVNVSAYTGASIRADTNIGDFYGAFYVLTFTTPATNNPNATGSGTQADLGELGTISNVGTTTIGTPFFWTQMIVGPYGLYTAATSASSPASVPYYASKQVFLSGIDSSTDTYTTNQFIMLLRVRGTINTAAGDPMPASGLLALFLSVPNTYSPWDPLAPAGFTYPNTASPFIGNNAIRCFSATGTQNCFNARNGRAATSTTTNVNVLDQYQIVTADVNYSSSSNFSLAMVFKNYDINNAGVVYSYRFGFVSNNLWYIQSWDQLYDNNGGYNPGDGTNAVAWPASGTCTLPMTVATGPAIRVIPASAGETTNTLVTESIGISANATITGSKFQGSAVWCARWNFRGTGFAIAASSALEALGDKCQTFDYQSIDGTAPYTSWYCIFCPISKSTGLTASGTTTISASNFLTNPAANILTPTFANIANDVGSLQDISLCTTTTGTSSATVYQPTLISTATTSGSSWVAQGQKVTVSFTAPSTLASVTQINFAGMNGSVANTADTQFPYGSFDSTNGACALVPTANLTTYSLYVSCVVTIASGNMSVGTFTIPTALASTTSWTLILWGFNGNAITGSTNNATSASFYMNTKNGTTLIDQSNSTYPSYFTWPLTVSPSLNFTTTNIGYQRTAVTARGYFRWDVTFPSNRPWYYKDKMTFNIDAIVPSTTGMKCYVTDSSDNVVQLFKSCNIATSSSPATVTLMALSSSSTSNFQYDFTISSLRIYLDNVVTSALQTTKTVWGYLYFAGSSTVSLTKLNSTTDLSSVTTLNTSQLFNSTTLLMTKYWAASNDYQDIVFTLTTTNVSLTSSSRITIVFPYYYNTGLTTRFSLPYCSINGVNNYCYVSNTRSLVLNGFPSSISGSSFVIRVSGIIAPPANYTADSFFVSVNSDNSDSASTILMAGTVSDAAFGSMTIVPINVVWSTVSTTSTRSLATLSWSFQLNATSSNTSAIQVIFPETWGLAWGMFTPTCSIADFSANSTSYASSQNIFGNIVNLNLSTAIPAAAVCTLTCTAVRTPDSDGTYPNQEVMIRLVDANGTNVYQRSSPSVHNTNFQATFAVQSGYTYLSWTPATSPMSTVNISAGTYSSAMILGLKSGSSALSFNVSLNNPSFGLYPTTVNFPVGASSKVAMLGCSGSVPPGYYIVTSSITDTTKYTLPNAIYVNVKSTIQTITPSATSLSTIYQSNGTSLTAPVTFDTSSMMPWSDITITPTISNTNFTASPASITLTPSSPKNWFVFQTTTGSAIGGSATVTYTISGTNAGSYSISGSTTLSIAADSSGLSGIVPTLSVGADSTDTSMAIQKTITFTLGQVPQATIYWVVGLAKAIPTDSKTILANAAAQVSYSSTSASQAQYFTTIQVTTPTKSPSSLTIGNLYSQTAYTVNAYAVSQANQTSSLATFNFTTGSNGANLVRWLFNFTSYPTQSQRQVLLCALSQQLSVPAANIQDTHGEYCGNTSALFTTANSSSGQLGVYFYPLQTNADTIMNNLPALLNTTSVLYSLNATTTNSNNASFNMVYSDGIQSTVAPALGTISTPTSSGTYVSVSGLTLTGSGFIFAALATNLSSQPSAMAFRQSVIGTATTGLIQPQAAYYYPGGSSVSFNFTGLSSSNSYTLYVMGSNNDPSIFANYTTVQGIAVTTNSSIYQTTFAKKIMVALPMIAISVIFAFVL